MNTSKLYIQTLESLGRHYKFNIDDKFSDIPEETKQKILYGSGDDKIEIIYNHACMHTYITPTHTHTAQQRIIQEQSTHTGHQSPAPQD